MRGNNNNNNNNNNLMLTLGLGVVVIGGVMLYVNYNNRVNKLENTLDAITNGINSIAKDVDLTVPDDIVKVAVAQAANKAADKAVNSAVTSIKATVAKNMDERITSTIKDVYGSLEEDMKKKLLEKVNLTSLEKIEDQVSDKVAGQVMKTMLSKVTSIGSGSSKADVAKYLAEQNYSSWQIKDILDAMN